MTKKTNKEKSPKKASNKEFESKLIENFVSLQKVMTSLSENFENLSNRMTELLDLFEESAKTLTAKDFKITEEKDNNPELLSRIDKLLEQNKIIARGITMIHDSKPTERYNEFSTPKPMNEIPSKYPMSKKSNNETIKPLNKIQEELGTKKSVVQEEGEDTDWSPEFNVPN